LLTYNQEETIILNAIKVVAQQYKIESWLVGGFVRDKLLGRPCKDIDIVCLGDGIELAKLVANQFTPTPNVVFYSRFGTAMFRFNDIDVEFVGARKESYVPESRNPQVSAGSIKDDQLRRDFTINSLAVSLNKVDEFALIDPFGGVAHLEQQLLITPGDPDITFKDDPLRILRAIRFSSQLHFKIDNATWSAIIKNKDRINIVSQERITTEFEKILASKKPSIGFKLLFDSGLLSIIFPEMAALQGIDTCDNKSHKDNFYHTLEVIDNLAKKSEDIWLRWAALLHDIAKPATKKFDNKIGWTFHSHEVLGASMVPKIFKKMRLPLDHKMKFVQKMVRLHLRPISLTKDEITDSAIRRLLVDAGEDLEPLMLLCEADITSKNRERRSRYISNYRLVREKIATVEERDRLRNWQPPIDGDFIMHAFNIGPSKEVGIIKQFIKDSILDGKIEDNKADAIEIMLRKGKELGLKPDPSIKIVL
jgi:poly(A) polymerase